MTRTLLRSTMPIPTCHWSIIIPNLQRYEAARVVATPDGSEPPYYRIFEGYFEDMEQLQSSMATPEGQAATNDIPNFATGGATVFISEIDA
jgi:uncharacterized protein (TIGR02118 family)